MFGEPGYSLPAACIQCLPFLQVTALTQPSLYTLHAAGGPCSNEENKSPEVSSALPRLQFVEFFFLFRKYITALY
jgi:hypothetical protein